MYWLDDNNKRFIQLLKTLSLTRNQYLLQHMGVKIEKKIIII